jgi:hypothetical protein
MDESTIGGYELSDKLAGSKRFRAFRASRRTPDGVRRGTLYLMTEEVRRPELFIETVDAIRANWPFAGAERDAVLPEAQLWTGRPWFFVPERLPMVASAHHLGRAAFASLRAQLRWLEEFQPPGGQGSFAHGDVRKERIALVDEEQPLLIAPGWVAAADYAGGRSLSLVRGDDVWHLGKLWIKESDHSFVPEGMEVDPEEAGRRLPLARLDTRGAERAARQPSPARPAAAHAKPSVATAPAARPEAAPPVAAKPAPAKPAARPAPEAPAAAARSAAPERVPARPAAANGASNGVATHRPAAPALPAQASRAASSASVTQPPPREALPPREPAPVREALPPREPAPVREAPANDVPPPVRERPQQRPPAPALVAAAPPPAASAAPPAPAAAPPVPIVGGEPITGPVRVSAPPAAPSVHPSQAHPSLATAPAPARPSNRIGAIAMFVVLLAVLIVAVLLFGR